MSVVSIENPDASKLILGLGLAGMLMTPEEFDAIDEADENYKYELIHGVLVVTPPPLEEERGPIRGSGTCSFCIRLRIPRDPRSMTRSRSNIFPRPTAGTVPIA